MADPRPADLLGVLPAAVADRLLAGAPRTSLGIGEVLFLAGDPADGCYRVDQGLVKVTIVSPDGGERILAVLGAGALVGELALLDGGVRSATVAAIRPTTLQVIPRAAFEAAAASHPEIFRHAARLLATRLRDTNAAIAAASFLPLKGRVARALLALAEAFGQPVPTGRTLIRQKLTQSDLAAMAGIARENVSRILNDWMRAKTVTRLSGYYCIEDRAALAREAEL